MHPEGRPYRWIPEFGAVVDGYIPYTTDIPDLPQKWVEFLTEQEGYVKPATAREYTKLEKDELLTEGEPCQAVQKALGDYLGRKLAGSPRHDAFLGVQKNLVRHGEWGHRGTYVAMETLREKFCTDAREDRLKQGAEAPESEFDRGLYGAIGKILNSPSEERTGTAATAKTDAAPAKTPGLRLKLSSLPPQGN